jgi:hypothetical protein
MSISASVSGSTVSATVSPGVGPAAISGWSGTFQAQVTYDGDAYSATFTITNGVITGVDLGEPLEI